MRLNPNYQRPHHTIGKDARAEALVQVERHMFQARALYQQLRLLAPRDAQRDARYVIDHAWNLVEVNVYGLPDKWDAEWGAPVLDRLQSTMEDFVVHVRGALRIADAQRVFTEADVEAERNQRLAAITPHVAGQPVGGKSGTRAPRPT